jgi:hypothetical protein
MATAYTRCITITADVNTAKGTLSNQTREACRGGAAERAELMAGPGAACAQRPVFKIMIISCQ